ncbi:MAG TPA: endo-1,4-beta-xylanase [Acidimicrobiales bacterium]
MLPFTVARGVLFGAATRYWILSPGVDDQYSSTLTANYNGVTPENAMKWAATEPAKDQYDFSSADPIVAFAAANHQQVRGHNLVWGNDNPAWLEQGTWTRDQLIQIMHDHISNVVTHFENEFPGTVTQWDVVNEAVTGPGQLVPNIWERVIGSDYISMAFQFAHQADPNSQLYYNDYGGEGLGPKSDAINWVAAYLKSTGVPIDGVGLESHFDLNPPPQADIASNMTRLASEGLKVAVTEMDVRLLPPAGYTSPTDAQSWDQAHIYYATLATCLAQPACSTFVTWGFTDKYSWIPTSYPGYGWALPFSDTYAHKSAYTGLAAALQGGADPYCTTYASPATGTHRVCGALLAKYQALGGPSGFLGYPTTDETPTPDGVGRFNHFANDGSIYWSPNTGAWSIHGAIRAKWASMGWEQGVLGYPTTDETGTSDGVGRFNHFSTAGSIYWTPNTGAWSIHGRIRDKYQALGGPSSVLGYPVTDENGTPDGVGRFNHFSNSGSIYWTPNTGAWSIHGRIRDKWASMGWERSCLRYPVSDEFAIPGGRQSNLQQGVITYSFSSGQATPSC